MEEFIVLVVEVKIKHPNEVIPRFNGRLNYGKTVKKCGFCIY